MDGSSWGWRFLETGENSRCSMPPTLFFARA